MYQFIRRAFKITELQITSNIVIWSIIALKHNVFQPLIYYLFAKLCLSSLNVTFNFFRTICFCFLFIVLIKTLYFSYNKKIKSILQFLLCLLSYTKMLEYIFRRFLLYTEVRKHLIKTTLNFAWK